MLERLKNPWPDTRAERLLGAVSLLVAAGVVVMIVFVAAKSMPLFQHNGLAWLTGGGDTQGEISRMQTAVTKPPASVFHFRAWPLIYGTLLTSVISVGLGLVIAILSSVFIVELAPVRVRAIVIPMVRLLASVPSVIYGLIGILVLVPFVGNHLVTGQEKESVSNVIQLTGESLLVTVVILTVMVTPIMVALICEALQSVPRSWREGAVALGLNPLRAVRAVTLRAIRPAIVAAVVLATARALGEAIVVAMVSGGKIFSPKLIDGFIVLFEPLKTSASEIVDLHESINAPGVSAAVYGLALLLLLSAFVLSVGGYVIKLPLRKYQTRG